MSGAYGSAGRISGLALSSIFLLITGIILGLFLGSRDYAIFGWHPGRTGFVLLGVFAGLLVVVLEWGLILRYLSKVDEASQLQLQAQKIKDQQLKDQLYSDTSLEESLVKKHKRE